MAKPVGAPTSVRVGPGRLLVAPLLSTEPVDLSTAWDADWVELGYTEDGSSFTASISNEAIPVAEEFDPIRYETTGREMRVEFALAEITADNLSTAMNGGTLTTGTGIVTFEPPEPGEEERVMLGWEATDSSERWVFRQCLQAGDVAIARRKAPAKATIPATFRLEKPTGAAPFKAIFDTTP